MIGFINIGEYKIKFNELPKHCMDCIHLKAWSLDMGGNHGMTCKKGSWNFKKEKCDMRETEFKEDEE